MNALLVATSSRYPTAPSELFQLAVNLLLVMLLGPAATGTGGGLGSVAALQAFSEYWLFAPVHRIVKLKVLAVVGVPLMTPVPESRISPVGSAPPLIVQV